MVTSHFRKQAIHSIYVEVRVRALLVFLHEEGCLTVGASETHIRQGATA
jgi:hypothetical protein